jgi:predicted Zn-dependent peptidase
MKYNKYNLKNGLTYINIPKKNDLISVGFLVKVGSRDEDKKNNGISHFLEHMLFKGTKNRNTCELLNELDNLGTIYNALTTIDFTAYELHGDNDDKYKLIDIILDLYQGANLYQKDINKERGVILEEYNLTMYDVSDIIFNIISEELFKGSSLELPIIGTKKNIKNFKRNDLIKFRNKYYCPSNTIFMTIGEVDEKKVINMINKKIKFECNDTNIRKQINFIQDKPRLNITNSDGNGQVNILIGFAHNGYKNKKEFNTEASIISNILTSGIGSILLNILRTKYGLAYGCQSDNEELEDNSLFYIRSAVDEKRCDFAIEKILEELYKLRNNGVKKVDIINIKKSIKNKKNLLDNQSGDLINYLYNAMKNDKLDYKKKLDMIDKKKVNEGIKHIFRNNNINVVVVGNVSKKATKNMINILNKWYHMIKN